MDSDWASLPIHLLKIISEKSETLRDYLYLGLVCASWNLATKDNQRKNMIRKLSQVPMLLIPSGDTINHSHAMYNVLTGRFLEPKLTIPIVSGRSVGSSRGWLVTIESDFSIKLHKAYPNPNPNPRVQGDSIFHLPPFFPDVDQADYIDYYVHKVIITADPLTEPDQCIVVVIFDSINSQVAFIRPCNTRKTKWTSSGDILLDTMDLLYYNNKFYALTEDGMFKSFRVSERFEILDVELLPKIPLQLEAIGKAYLVEFRGKILQVVRRFAWRLASEQDETLSYRDDYVVDRATRGVLVFEFDNDKKIWVEVEDLGDCTMFLGDNSSLSVVSSNFAGCRPNCIYFTHDYDEDMSSCAHVSDLGVYDFRRKQMELNFGSETTVVANYSNRIPIWVVPYAQ